MCISEEECNPVVLRGGPAGGEGDVRCREGRKGEVMGVKGEQRGEAGAEY